MVDLPKEERKQRALRKVCVICQHHGTKNSQGNVVLSVQINQAYHVLNISLKITNKTFYQILVCDNNQFCSRIKYKKNIFLWTPYGINMYPYVNTMVNPYIQMWISWYSHKFFTLAAILFMSYI